MSSSRPVAAVIELPDTPRGILTVDRISTAEFLAGALRTTARVHHLSNATLAALPPSPDESTPAMIWDARERKVVPAPPLPAVPPNSLLFQTAHRCFAHHVPFSLAPEVVWFAVLHEVAETVRRHPGRYAHLFTHAPDEPSIVRVFVDDFVFGAPNDWTRGVAQFDAALRERVPAGIMDHLLPAFSTRTAVTDVALLIAFMDAASPFYDYRMRTRCGIPRVRVEGTADDWRRIVHHAAALAEVFAEDLGRYFGRLVPVLQSIADIASGATPAPGFWGSLYKLEGLSGGPYLTGWITRLLAYSVNARGALVPFDGDHLTIDAVPAHVASVRFIWEYYHQRIPMRLVSGVLDVEVDGEFMAPRLGFAVIEGHE